jgi:peroxiredoxin
MALTPSNSITLGTTAPDFTLLNTIDEKLYSLYELKGKVATVILFICNHCPFVKHINAQLVTLAHEFIPQGIAFIAISANDAEKYPQDSPALMKLTAEQEGYPFVYLYDKTQEVAKAYHAACTPDNFIFDANIKLVYHGQIDDSRPGNGIPVTGDDLRHALQQIIAGSSITAPQKPSVGCNIKWR